MFYHSKILTILFSVFERENGDIIVLERALNSIKMISDAITDHVTESEENNNNSNSNQSQTQNDEKKKTKMIEKLYS